MKKHLLPFLSIALLFISCTKLAAVEEETIDKNGHLQKVGAAAHHLLSDETYTRLDIEVSYMPGYAPDSAALQNLKHFLFEHLHKPGGIRISTKEIAPAKDTVLNLNEIAAIENANRKQFTRRNTIAVHLLYTNGHYTQDKMLGYAYRNTSAVIFTQNIIENADKPKKLSRTHLETIVLQHEMGHLLGLVNMGTPLQSDHKDSNNGKHCTNSQCLMYHVADTDDIPGLLFKKQLPRLDDACLADLKANGGR